MERLLSFLLFAAFFYLMMRFGCGAHMVHGGHGSHQHVGKADEGSAQDPVCGMQVGPGQGYAKNHQGRMLHFCSRTCLDKFEAEPQRYVA
jgi:YHS domain-containing protein